MKTLKPDALPLYTEPDGSIRIGESRVLLDLVIGAHKAGATPEWIVSSYHGLELADVYTAIAYYLRHTETVDAYLARREKEAARLRREIVKKQGPRVDGLRKRVEKARRR